MAITSKPNLFEKVGSTNVLNYFRSYNYLFTLSCVSNDDFGKLTTADQVSKLSSKFVIAKSSGKTDDIRFGINPDDSVAMSKDLNSDPVIKYDDKGYRLKPNLVKNPDAKDTVKKFNETSPGRFDFYFDDVEIETIISFDKKTGFSKATKLEFVLIEPYSLAGFLEALQTAAVAAGHPTYKSAPFMFKIEFKGYPDWTNVADDAPVIIEPASRYFIIRFSDLSIKADERGTRYSCKAVPINELGFGETNKLKTSLNIEGNTVGKILENMFDSINRSNKETNKIRNEPTITGNLAQVDEYVIKFPKVDSSTNEIQYSAVNETLKNTRVADLSKSNKSYSFLDRVEEANKAAADAAPASTPATAQTNTPVSKPIVYAGGSAKRGGLTQAQLAAAQAAPGSGSSYAGAGRGGSSYTDPRSPLYGKQPTTTPVGNKKTAPITQISVQFVAGANIHDCISAILRDSEYGTSIFSEDKLIRDENDMVNWFNVMIEAVPKDIWNSSKNQPYYIYTYYVIPYKIHYTRIPGFEGGTMDEAKVTKQVRRVYNYLYTGQNVDVLNFNLVFNNLYFQNDPLRGGNQPIAGGTGAASYPEQADVRRIDNQISEQEAAKSSGSAINEKMSSYRLVGAQSSGETTGPIEKEPYALLAQNLHYAILENVGMATLELEIVGDPVYLVQSGIGNIRTKANSQHKNLTDVGTIDHQVADVFVIVNFKNPKDIQPLNKGGTMEMNKVASFSGFYKVLTVNSSFKGGQFTQKLHLLRMPSQSTDSNQTTEEIAATYDTFVDSIYDTYE
jgi:hypothetical protein